jgi:redox-sensitive bicupin YhaK (pirin superfamily)
MSAGTGVVHSEFNHSPTEKVHFLQIWIVPKERDIEPKYNQKYFSEEDKLNKLAKIISPNGSDNSIEINQDTTIFASIVDKDGEVKFTPSNDKDYWIHVVQGNVNFQEYNLKEGDGVAITKGELSEMIFRSSNKGEFLLFEI